jgi:hypothetical protein
VNTLEKRENSKNSFKKTSNLHSHQNHIGIRPLKIHMVFSISHPSTKQKIDHEHHDLTRSELVTHSLFPSSSPPPPSCHSSFFLSSPSSFSLLLNGTHRPTHCLCPWRGRLAVEGTRCSSLFVWLVADGWCWFVLREKYCWLVAGGWFVLREKHCWLVADKPNEQAGRSREGEHIVLISVS